MRKKHKRAYFLQVYFFMLVLCTTVFVHGKTVYCVLQPLFIFSNWLGCFLMVPLHNTNSTNGSLPHWLAMSWLIEGRVWATLTYSCIITLNSGQVWLLPYLVSNSRSQNDEAKAFTVSLGLIYEKSMSSPVLPAVWILWNVALMQCLIISCTFSTSIILL